MIYLVSQNGKVAYGVKEYIADSIEDIQNLDTSKLAPGSKIYISGTAESYILSPAGELVEEKDVPSVIPTPPNANSIYYNGEFLTALGDEYITTKPIAVGNKVFAETPSTNFAYNSHTSGGGTAFTITGY